MKSITCKKIVVAIMASIALTGAASAQIIYYEDTLGNGTESGSLTGSTPDTIDTNGNVWSNASIGYNRTAFGAVSTGPYDNAYLAVNGTSGVTLNGLSDFTLTVTVNNATSGTGMGITLADSALNTGNQFNGAGGTNGYFLAQMGLYGSGELTNLTGDTFLNAKFGLSPVATLSLVYSASAGTISYYYDSIDEATLTGVSASEIAALNFVGIGNGSYADNPNSMSNFELYVAGSAPEPSTYAMLGAGLLMLTVCIRRRRVN